MEKKLVYWILPLIVIAFSSSILSGCRLPGDDPGDQTVAKPTFAPVAGTYQSDQSVAIDDATSGTTVYYTVKAGTTGITPTTSSTQYTTPISVAGNGTTVTVEALAVKSGWTNSAVAAATYVINYPQIATPAFAPVGGTYQTDQSVAINDATSGTTVYYTVTPGNAGVTPTASSTKYTGPISVAGNGTTVTIEALAVKTGMMDSLIASATYAINYSQVTTPAFAPVAGTYQTDQSVAVTEATNGATVYYTVTPGTTGAIPTTSSTQYAGPIAVAGNGTTVTIEALAVKSGMANSAVATSTYTINYSQVAMPTFAPVAGTYQTDQSVAVNEQTNGATVYYTATPGTTGVTPTTSSAQYAGPISVAGNGTTVTIEALAVKSGMADSAVATATYTINYSQVALPTFAPVAGTYQSDQSVAVNEATNGATVYYTATPGTTGVTPTTSSAQYAGPIAVAGNGTTVTIEALAVKAGMADSAVATATYVINYLQVQTPTFAPVAGTYQSDQSVAVNEQTNGATVYYTVTPGTTGTAPTTSSPQYAGPINVAGNGTTVTIEALAVKVGMLDSAVATATYVINYPQLPTPTFSPSGGTYQTDQSIAISDATGGATIYYTVTPGNTGTTPTASSAQYSGLIPVAGNGTTVTIEALAVKGGMLDSAVATETYVINYPQAATPTFAPLGGIFQTDQNVVINDATGGVTIHYTVTPGNAGVTPTISSAQYSGSISVAGNGTTVTVEALAVKSGMTDSLIASATYVVNYPPAATPTFAPSGGNYQADQSVVISDATNGTTVYYTVTPGTTGTAPTTSSMEYTGPIAVAGNGKTVTIEALAVKGGMTD